MPDPALRAKLTPDYRVGCKRIILSDDWYPALQAPNATVVTDEITGLAAGGVQTRDESGKRHLHQVDAVATARNQDRC